MAQNLCPVLLALIDLCSGANTDMNTKPNWGEFNYTWTCVIIFFIVFAMTAIKDLNIFVRINSFGVIFITLIILMIMGLGFYSFSDTKFTYNESTYD
jgi:heme/copper-type cytochrome/quinol oxidase subunit 2